MLSLVIRITVRTLAPWDKMRRTGERSLSINCRVLSFEEGLALRKRRGLAPVPHSLVNSLHNANLATVPTGSRKCLLIFDGLTGRDPPQIGTIENKWKPGSVDPTNNVAPSRPTEHAMIEAAIQLDLITPEQAEALISKGKTLGEWLVEKEKGKAIEARNAKQRMLDTLGVLALLVFNLVVLMGFGWIVLRIMRWL
jgi:hypothetical protein